MHRPSFSALARVYDDIMVDVDYEAWCDFIIQQAHRRGYRGGRILDLGCGTGNATLPLARRAHCVEGLDRSREMLEVASAKAPGIQWWLGEFTSFELPRRFDLIVSVFDSLNNLLELAELRSTIDRVREHLQPGGLFLFDMNTTVGLSDLWEGEPVEGWVGETYYRWLHSFDPDSRLARVEVYCESGDSSFTELHLERPYDEWELRPMLEEAGFIDTEVLQYPAGLPASPDAERIWVCARAPGAA